MMNYYKKWNLIAGWGVFLVTVIVHYMTMEPSASFWDCSEYISTSYKLEVGHPPGAPIFMLVARFFSMFASSPQYAAVMTNLLSVLCSGFTILFMFWTISHFGCRMYRRRPDQMSRGEIWSVLAAALIGSLAYTFTDTFWFSSVETETYAMASMLLAIIVWAMLKWEDAAGEPGADRWLVLIFYLLGLSIGVRIIPMLALPALAFIYYFKKYPVVTFRGLVSTTLVAFVILLGIYGLIMPYTLKIGGAFDRWFVNGMGLPINSGMIFFALLVFVLCGLGVYWSHKKGKAALNTVMLCTTVIFIGFSSYAAVTIRASADPPMNSNNPDNPHALLSLLSRDQYGDRPLLYGNWYSAPPIDYKENTVWYIDDQGKYAEGSTVTGLVYPSEFKTLFPRMYHYAKAEEYEKLVDIKGRQIPYRNQLVTVPTFGENLQFFVGYQMNFMYWRYFLWNFVGRQSDNQSLGEITEGNWLSGIKFIDELYLGPQDGLPREMADNKGRNKYYFLPFILGLIGLVCQLGRDKRNFSVVLWLFIMLGIAVIVYFNPTPGEPRERDYIFSGSFYAFSLWIGVGVIWVRDWLAKLTKNDSIYTALGALAICSTVPILLAAQNWDDHDRSNRYVARDCGWNYLNACLPNSIIMNYGDNDTFPLWYNQEVEGVRLDVKIMNMSYLGGDWYIDQMKQKSNEAGPVPFSLPRSKYVNTNDAVTVYNLFDYPVDIRQVIDFVRREDQDTKIPLGDGTYEDYIPANKLAIPVNKENALASGIVRAEDAHLMVDTVYLNIEKNRLYKNELMFLDLLANFDWNRPLYFTQIHDLRQFGLWDYLQYDGFAYRLVPIRTPMKSFLDLGRVDTEYLWNNLMDLFRYGNIEDPKVYADTFVQNNYNTTNARNGFAVLAKALMAEGDTIRAVQALDRGLEKVPFSQIRYTFRSTYPHIEAYYLAGEFEKGNEVLTGYASSVMEHIVYFSRFTGRKAQLVDYDLDLNYQYLSELFRIALAFGQDEVADWIEDFYMKMSPEEGYSYQDEYFDPDMDFDPDFDLDMVLPELAPQVE
ncbi:MAG: DUF2723 domain-containing protein [Rikenellaceae bacterium]|nr:DUF2723 domain-containing protein [Rikenellaceae bacterium]